MKKYLVSIIIALTILATTTPAKADNGLYARCFVVTGVEYGTDGINLVIIEDCNRFVYAYYEDEILYVGDAVVCLIYDNGTPLVTDDIILDGWYERIDLLLAIGKGGN